MKTIFLFLITFIANTILAIEPVILSKERKEYPIGIHLEILEDKEGKLTIADILKPEYENLWIRNEKEVPGFGFTNSAYWTRFKIIPERDAEYYLEIGYPLLDNIEYYSLENNEIKEHRKSGDMVAFKERDLNYRNFVFRFDTSEQKEKYFYLRFETQGSMQIPIKIWNPTAFTESKMGEMGFLTFFFGILFVMAIYNLFIWFSVKDKSYFFYVCTIVFTIINILILRGFIFQYFWFGSPSLYNRLTPTFLFYPEFLFPIIFTSYYLNIKNNLYRFHQIYKLIVLLLICAGIISPFLSYKIATITGTILGSMACIWMFTVGFIMVLKSYRPARFYFIGWSALLIGSMISLLQSYSIIPSNFFTNSSTAIGSALEVILLSLGLADRINVLKLENEKVQKEALRNQQLAIDNLEKANKLKDEFLANTSHELRTPLNGIIGIAESLFDGIAGQLSNKVNENLSLIVSSGKRLSSLVNDILDFSKLKHKDLQIHLQPVDIYSITNLVLKLSEPLVKSKDLQLVNEIPETISAVFADENRLQQILYNVIGNAIKFTEKGTVIVTAELVESTIVGDAYMLHLQSRHRPMNEMQPAKVKSKDNAKFIQITVTDTGIGIPPDKLEAIFESFEQVDASSTRQYGGTGLGLSVTKQLVELQGGEIWVKSELKKGSKFIFTLPVTQEKPIVKSENTLSQKIETVEEVIQDYTPTPLNRKAHILAVDDEPINLQVISNHFTFRGYRVTTANTGKEALNFLEKNEKPDLILLDVMMPMMTGFEVCQKIREKYDLNQLPVLFLTAKNSSNDLLEGFNVAGNDYILKPFSKAELISRVETHIKLKDYAENLEKKVEERTLQLNEKMEEVQALKLKQDADYYLTSLLIEPLMTNKAKSDRFDISFFIEQKKRFNFRNKSYQIGGDICISENLILNGKKFIFFFNGDAMGKSIQGAGGALVIGSVLNSILIRFTGKDNINISPEEWLRNTLEEMDAVMFTFDGLMLISCIIGLIDESTDEMIYFNVEHPSLILIRDNKISLLENKLGINKIGMFFLNKTRINVNKILLKKDDIILLGSDGKNDISKEGNIISDEENFINNLNYAELDFKSIYDSILKLGDVIDDISLMKIVYK